MTMNPEQMRLADHDAGKADWKRWGTYLSDRAWGTVREDYSADGDSWNYFPHDHARSRAYRWNEDGIGGFCDEKQNICLAVALWNEKDPIFKERMFGLSNQQGNHGEDVKEYYFFPRRHADPLVHEDALQVSAGGVSLRRPGRSQRPARSVAARVRTVRRAQRHDSSPIATSTCSSNTRRRVRRIFSAGSRRSTAGPTAAPIHVLPHLWYRNTWSWAAGRRCGQRSQSEGAGAASTTHPEIGRRLLVRAGLGRPGGRTAVHRERDEFQADRQRAEHVALCEGRHPRCGRRRRTAGREWQTGQQAGGPCDRRSCRPAARLPSTFAFRRSRWPNRLPISTPCSPAAIAEADTFYKALAAGSIRAPTQQLVARQAFAGLLWSKQYYHYDVYRWLKGDPTEPPPPDSRWKGRNSRWKELHNADVILMPDTWEYPWYASWDLAFHCVAISHIDPAFAKEQLLMMGYEWYQHANGQFPAYEWNFDDVNPPVQCWAAWRVYQIEFAEDGRRRHAVSKAMFQNEMLNFSFWVNRKDRSGRDVFGGGFLGMDNIGCFDRDKPLADGGQLEQSDGTSWMALYCNHDAHHLGRACGERAVLPEHGDQVFRALSLHRPRHDEHGRGGDRFVGQ